MNELSQLINELYRAFEDVPKPEEIVGCPCCIDEIELKRLLRVAPRQLTEAELSAYASSALLTVGDVADYLYFLPRILEISIADDSWWPTIEVTGRAIRTTMNEAWPDNRLNALTNMLTGFIDHIVSSREYGRIDEWMCAIGRMELDVRPMLSIIEREPEAVIAFWEDNAGKLGQGRLGNEFWETPNMQHDEIVRWFKSPKINLIYAETYGYRMEHK